ncbi:MAG: tail fiber domain-containing protein [Flavobacteriales bacterium]|nr:tail fiber domain-containing protein [Flavobacteriales bacterium]
MEPIEDKMLQKNSLSSICIGIRPERTQAPSPHPIRILERSSWSMIAATCFFAIVLQLISPSISKAQVGIGTTTPDPSSLLDLVSTSKGVLISKMTTAQRNAIASPARGLLVFVTSDSTFYYNQGLPATPNWVKLLSASSGTGGWTVAGNAGTNWTTNFLGTTDNISLRIRTNNTEKMIVDSVGNVGIGTPSPTVKLHVQDAAFTNMSIESTGAGSQITVASPSSNGSNITFLSNNQLRWQIMKQPDASHSLQFNRYNTSGVSQGTAMVIDGTNGNVGIGTTSPSGIFHVSSNTATDMYFSRHTTDNAGTATVFRKSRGTAAIPTIVAADDDAGLVVFDAYDGTAYREVAGILAEVDATPGVSDMPGRLVFYTTPDGSITRTERMRIINNGNVGIGTTAPGSKLHVSGNMRLSSVPATNRFILLGDDGETNTGTGGLVVQAGAGSSGYGGALNLFAHSHATKPGWVTAGLSVSAGTGATEARFTVNNQGLAGGTDVFTVLRSGNVGIGTTSPAEKLHLFDGGTGIVEIEGGTVGSPARRAIVKLTSDIDFRARGLLLSAGNAPKDWFAGISYSGGLTGANFFTIGRHATQAEYPANSFVAVDTSGNVGIGTTAPDADALLEMSSTTKGILIPRMTTAERNAITTPPTGLLVFGTTDSSFYYYDGSSWVPFLANSSGASGGWSLTGNAGTTVGTNFLGTTDAKDFAIYTNNTEKVRVTSAGNVGIGTASPTNSLEIGNSGHTGYSISTRSATFGAVIQTEAAGNNAAFWVRSDVDATPIEILYARNNGNVGIGTTSPYGKLDVNGGTPAAPVSGNNGGAKLSFNATANTIGSGPRILNIYPTDIVDGHGLGVSNGMTELYTNGNFGFFIRPNRGTIAGTYTSTEVMRITSAGNVGIGTASPSVKLHIEGATRVDVRMQDADELLDEKIWDFSTGVIGNKIFALVTRTDAGVFGQTVWRAVRSGTNVSSVSFPNGNVGIGTTGPSDKLHVSAINGSGITIDAPITPVLTIKRTDNITGTGNINWVGSDDVVDWQIGVNDVVVGSFDIQEGTASRLFIEPGGNVGIGTTDPGAKLEVSGNQIFGGSGIAGANNVLTHLSSGQAANETILRLGYWNGTINTGIWDVARKADNSLAFRNMISGSEDVARSMYITSPGNVGIGTTSPLKKVHINSTTGDATIRLQAFDGISFADIQFYDGVAQAGWLGWHDGDAAMKLLSGTTSNGAEGIVVKSGNVGIGTTSPLDKFNVHNDQMSVSQNIVSDTEYDWLALRSNRTINDYGGLNTEYARIYYRTPLSEHRRGALRIAVKQNTLDAVMRDVMTLNFDGNVGIGTTAPTDNLHIATTDANATITLDATSTGPSVASAIQHKRAGSIRWWVGASGNGGVDDYEWFRYDNTGAFLGTAMTIERATGDVGIGIAPAGQFELSLDEGRKPATGTWTIVSDERLKNIEGSYTKGLSEILQLQPITYRYKNVGERKFPEEVLIAQNVGFSAQEIQKIFPEAVGTDADGYLNFNMHAILVAYVNAIQELEAQHTALAKAMELKDTQLAAEISKMKEEHNREIAEIKSILGISAKK